ncbi:SixA phosphatase family protein [Litorisediminicola beolgyonensis]|uniref:SixA phosphatase family protein n=1 Tax=Litorisediminicola beolgyonensis TaxID=1173614 RepID=A0ABW3ZEG5_9RHOB
MKRLVLMRHAKSDWSVGEVDIERPLNKRGRKSAEALGQWLRDEGIAPDQVLCSTAVRTQETCAGLGLDIGPTLDERLYLAEPEQILASIAGAEGDCLLVLGHNPGIAMAARALVSNPPRHPRFSDYPTGATLIADLDIDDWDDIRWGRAKAQGFVIPRELV